MSDALLRFPSVASLYVAARCGNLVLSNATAFAVKSKAGHVLVTNRHVVRGTEQVTNRVLHTSGAVPDNLLVAHHAAGKPGTWIVKAYDTVDTDGLPAWTEHPNLGAQADIAAIALQPADDTDIFAYEPLNQSRIADLGPSEVLSVVGFPFGKAAGALFPIWSTGFMASEPALNVGGLPVFYVDCRSRPGQSGSAVVSHRKAGDVFLELGKLRWFSEPTTKLLGIYSGRIHPESDIGIVWKASAVVELVEAAGKRVAATQVVGTEQLD